MPEQLNPQLKALRDQCAAFAREHMLPLADVDHGDAAKKVRAASKQAGLFGLTQPDSAISKDARQLALCVARETLAAANPPALDAVFGPGPGYWVMSVNPWHQRIWHPCLQAKSAAALALPNRMMRSLHEASSRAND